MEAPELEAAVVIMIPVEYAVPGALDSEAELLVALRKGAVEVSRDGTTPVETMEVGTSLEDICGTPVENAVPEAVLLSDMVLLVALRNGAPLDDGAGAVGPADAVLRL